MVRKASQDERCPIGVHTRLEAQRVWRLASGRQRTKDQVPQTQATPPFYLYREGPEGIGT
jgi:hypothetical protein